MASCYARLEFNANGTAVAFDIELAWPAAAVSASPGSVQTQTQPRTRSTASGTGAAPAPAARRIPVMLTQWNHRSWGLNAVQRGYMMVLYPGNCMHTGPSNSTVLHDGTVHRS